MRSIFWIGLGLLLGVLDYTVAHHLTIFGMAPSLIFLTVVLAGLLEKRPTSLIVGFVLGLVADAMTANSFGAKTIAFTLIAFIVVALRRNTISYSVALQIAAVVIATVIALVADVLFASFYGAQIHYGNYLWRWYLPFIVFNAIAMPVFAVVVKNIHTKFVKYFD